MCPNEEYRPVALLYLAEIKCVADGIVLPRVRVKVARASFAHGLIRGRRVPHLLLVDLNAQS